MSMVVWAAAAGAFVTVVVVILVGVFIAHKVDNWKDDE